MLYIGTDLGIYRWFSGTPWPIFHSLQGRAIVSLVAPGGGVLVALDDGARVWESLNNGIDWRSVPAPDGAGRATTLAWVEGGEVVLATARPMGLYRRPIGLASATDAPAAFSRAKKLEDAVIGRARTLAARIRGVSGTTATLERPATVNLHGWVPMANPAAESAALPAEVRLIAHDAGTLYAAVTGAGLWKSDDLGGSWSRLPGLPDDVYAVRFAGKMVVAGTSGGVWISGDGGHTWADSSVGLENARQVRALDIKPTDPKVLLAGAAPVGAGEGPIADRGGLRFALYESKDAGKTWKHVTRGFPELLESDSIADIRYLPEDPTYAAIALASGEMWNTNADGLWWEPLARQIRGARAMCVAP
ncbi:MAG: hypothetical protein JWN86_4365 [Planctomycetota bacterium]|nr:hypothetical protein [Planctomycetota bacterium]